MSKTEKAAEILAFGGNIHEIGNLGTQFDLIRFMKRVTDFYGTRSFMVLNLPPTTSRELSANTIITNWPAELMTLFDREGLMQNSLAFSRLRGSTAPFAFDLETIGPERMSPRVREMFLRFGIVRGAYFP